MSNAQPPRKSPRNGENSFWVAFLLEVGLKEKEKQVGLKIFVETEVPVPLTTSVFVRVGATLVLGLKSNPRGNNPVHVWGSREPVASPGSQSAGLSVSFFLCLVLYGFLLLVWFLGCGLFGWLCGILVEAFQCFLW